MARRTSSVRPYQPGCPSYPPQRTDPGGCKIVLLNNSAQYSMRSLPSPYSLEMTNSSRKPKKAAARYQAVARNHAQARPTYLAHAKNVVKLAEPCVFQLTRDQLRSGFRYEDAIRIFIAYLNSFSNRTRSNWVGLVGAARLIGISPIELEAMAEAGEVRSMKVRRGYRFFAPDLIDWIVAQPVTPHQADLATPGDPGRQRRPRRNP